MASITPKWGAPAPYSPGEKMVLEVLRTLPEGKRLKTSLLAAECYSRLGAEMPRSARQSVLVIAKSLQRKADENKEPWKVCRSRPSGPHEVEWWLEPR